MPAFISSLIPIRLVAALPAAGLASAVLGFSSARAQGAAPGSADSRAAAFSSELQYAAGNAAPCGNGTQLLSTVSARGARVTLLPGPITAFATDRIGAPVVAAAWASAPARRWGFEASGAVGGSNESCAARSNESRALVGVSRRVGNGGVSMTLGSRSLSSLDPSRDREGVTVGGWHTVGPVRLSLELRRHGGVVNGWRYFTVRRPIVRGGQFADSLRRRVDTVSVPDSAQSDADWRSLDARTRAQMAFGRLSLDFTVGGSRSDEPLRGAGSDSGARDRRNTLRLWGRADARLAVGSSVELIGALISLPSRPTARQVPGPVVTFGVGVNGVPRFGRGRDIQVDPSSTREGDRSLAFETVRTDSLVRFRVRLPDASEVELSSELTEWRPITMTRSDDGWWELPLRASPGVYRINIRVNGGDWAPPPGVPAVRDEFGGSVGLVPLR